MYHHTSPGSVGPLGHVGPDQTRRRVADRRTSRPRRRTRRFRDDDFRLDDLDRISVSSSSAEPRALGNRSVEGAGRCPPRGGARRPRRRRARCRCEARRPNSRPLAFVDDLGIDHLVVAAGPAGTRGRAAGATGAVSRPRPRLPQPARRAACRALGHPRPASRSQS